MPLPSRDISVPGLSSALPVKALWYDGVSAGEHPVLVFIDAPHQELRLCRPGAVNGRDSLAVWYLHGLHARDDAGSGALRLRKDPDDGQRLIFTDQSESGRVRDWIKGALQARRQKSRKRWLLAVGGIWGLFLVLYLSGSLIFSGLAGLVPRPWEEALGKSARDSLTLSVSAASRGGGVNKEATKDAGLAALMRRLEKAAPVDGYTFDVQVLQSDLVNAFALPGGYLVLTSGLILDCESPDELAGILGHEMAHVTRRHGLAGMLRQYTWSLLLRSVTGADSFGSDVAKFLVGSAFSRDDEREADRLGARRTADAGINPAAQGAFFERLAQKHPEEAWGFLNYLSSHPLSKERKIAAEELLRQISESGSAPAFTPAMSEEAWKQLRLRCQRPQTPMKDAGQRAGQRAGKKTPEGE